MEEAMGGVDTVMASRYSCRSFTSTPIPKAVLEDILSVASRSPSGTNTQPWNVWIVSGALKRRLSEQLIEASRDPDAANNYTEPYPYYPQRWISPFIDRRRKVGFDLYGLLGIQKGDRARMQEQNERNYHFFDAPVGLIFTTHTVMEQGSYLDYGMFLQSIMIAAKARGLDTCPQAALNPFHKIIKTQLGIGENQTMVCAMSIGYAKQDAPENQLRTERAPLEEWVKFLD
jgi:nitroreductase